ncbi:MAG: hypothetical protein OXC03_11105 [Flavobacteriaceae bacterium]|nr:hypothetical protein [Flavobacteriaceae bacterium]
MDQLSFDVEVNDYARSFNNSFKKLDCIEEILCIKAILHDLLHEKKQWKLWIEKRKNHVFIDVLFNVYTTWADWDSEGVYKIKGEISLYKQPYEGPFKNPQKKVFTLMTYANNGQLLGAHKNDYLSSLLQGKDYIVIAKYFLGQYTKSIAHFIYDILINSRI